MGNGYQAVFVSGDIDGDDFLEAEIPFEIRNHERGNEASAGSVDVNGTVDIFGDQKVIDGLNIFVLASVGGANDGANANSILVDQVDGLFRVNHIAILCAVDVALLDVEVPRCFLPADLDSGIHDNVGF